MVIQVKLGEKNKNNEFVGRSVKKKDGTAILDSKRGDNHFHICSKDDGTYVLRTAQGDDDGEVHLIYL